MKKVFSTLDEFLIDISVLSEELKFLPGLFGNKFTKLLVVVDQWEKF